MFTLFTCQGQGDQSYLQRFCPAETLIAVDDRMIVLERAHARSDCSHSIVQQDLFVLNCVLKLFTLVAAVLLAHAHHQVVVPTQRLLQPQLTRFVVCTHRLQQRLLARCAHPTGLQVLLDNFQVLLYELALLTRVLCLRQHQITRALRYRTRFGISLRTRSWYACSLTTRN